MRKILDSSSCWVKPKTIKLLIVIMIAIFIIKEFRFTKECHHFINVHKIEWWVDFICASPSGFFCDETW